ncbi:MAG: hypothetical protein KAX57_05915 [Rhodoferax sp.]|jgi:hypothetical protein|uniref:hypothetical protein n=1 Tax=Rhodoferax sp. TaxID=50421 RepID=UPI001B3E1F7D|nr:hypothetical protein [Rhodoferax sp.]MBP8286359.1 hypothetical protein [Rhodoferax sp.]MBP9148308.1 hypothetical protein [Rhodoferax sp.]MBP9736970.1 hypothetical protein [Rhodoferax sp.]
MRLVLPAILLAVVAPSAGAQTAKNADCYFEAELLSAQFGIAMKAGVPEKGFLAHGCQYVSANGKIKFLVDAGPNPAPSADAWRKMANPPGTKFPIVPNDPDKAVRIDSPNGVYPTLSYERGGWLVVTRILGATTADAETWYGKLIKLKRIP